MFYYLYQITNLVNNKIYVGVHKTKSLNDGYMGSGSILKSAILKHGIFNFEKVILEHFDNQEAMYAREKEIVTEEFLERDDVYNLRRGGHGGFDHINKIGKNVDIMAQRKNDPTLMARTSVITSIVMKRIHANKSPEEKLNFALIGNAAMLEKYPNGIFYNKVHTQETKDAIGIANSVHQTGEGNSQFGTMWITDGDKPIKIKKTDLIPDGYRKGRK